MTRALTYVALRPRIECLGAVPCPDSRGALRCAGDSAKADACAILRGGVFCSSSDSYKTNRVAFGFVAGCVE